jgi:hypothetical protein
LNQGFGGAIRNPVENSDFGAAFLGKKFTQLEVFLTLVFFKYQSFDSAVLLLDHPECTG